MFRIFLIFTIGTFLLVCNAGTSVTVNRSEIEKQQAEIECGPEEYLVYSALIDQLFPNDESGFVIYGRTVTYYLPYPNLEESLRVIKERSSGELSDELLNGFLETNKSQSVLSEHLNIKAPYELLSEREAEAIFADRNDLLAFNRKFPGKSMITLSRIAFSKDGEEAFVYISRSAGPKTGSGYYLVLTKANNNWTIAHKFEIWTA